MSREIKFRGCAVSEMVESQWLYGFGVDPIEFSEEYAKEIGRQKDWYLYTDSGAIRVHEKSIGQFTGLRDKSGTEIYEHDIVRVNDDWIANVEFWQGCFMVDDDVLAAVVEACEVIGNIHENSDLLEVTE